MILFSSFEECQFFKINITPTMDENTLNLTSLSLFFKAFLVNKKRESCPYFIYLIFYLTSVILFCLLNLIFSPYLIITFQNRKYLDYQKVKFVSTSFSFVSVSACQVMSHPMLDQSIKCKCVTQELNLYKLEKKGQYNMQTHKVTNNALDGALTCKPIYTLYECILNI